MYKNEQYKGTHEFTKGKLGRRTRGPGRIELWTVCWRSTLPLRHSDQQLGESTRSKLHDLNVRSRGVSDTPQASVIESQVAKQDEHKCAYNN